MRVALLSLHTSPLTPPGGHKAGGMNVYVGELARRLGAAGIEVDVLTRRTTNVAPRILNLSAGVQLIHLDGAPPGASNDDLVAAADALADEVAAFAGTPYDIVHSNYWVSGPTGMRLSRRWEVPHAVMFHTLAEIKNRVRSSEHEPQGRIEVERTLARTAHRIVCATDHEAGVIQRLYGASPHRLSVIPCGVDLRAFRPRDERRARRKLGLDDGPLVLYVGRLEPLKGIDLLIDAFARLPASSYATPPRLLLLGGGDGDEAALSALRKQATELGVAGRVEFRGLVGRDDLPDYYNAADVCVVPSFYESFGLVAVEAMASGTPVVASRVGGLATTVRDGVTGYLIPWRCPEPFAERIDLLLANDGLRRSFGRAARASVEQLSWENVANRVLQMYSVLAGRMERRAS